MVGNQSILTRATTDRPGEAKDTSGPTADAAPSRGVIATAAVEARAFVRCFSRVAREGLRGRRLEAFIVVGVDLAAAAAGGSAIAFVGYIASLLQSGGSVALPRSGLRLAQDDMLLVSALVLFVLLIFAAGAGYFSAVRTRAIARAYHRHCARRMLEALERSIMQGLANSHLAGGRLQLQVGRNPLHLGKSLETVVQMIKPICYIAVGLAIILYLDAKLAALMVPAFLVLIPAGYMAARRIDRDARAYFQDSAPNFNLVIRPILDAVRFTSTLRASPPLLAQSYDRDARVERFFDDFDGLQLADNKMTLITGGFKGFFLAIVFLIVGHSVLREEGSWGTAIALLGAFVLLLNNFQALSGLVANLQRFYPQVAEYGGFYQALSPGEVRDRPALPPAIRIASSQPILPGGQSPVSLVAGCPLLLCLDRPFDRGSLSRTIDVLAESSDVGPEPWSDFDFVGRNWRYFDGTVIENLTAFQPSQERRARVKALLEETELTEAVDRLPHSLDTRLDDGLWDTFPADLKAAMRLIPLTFTPGRIVFVDGDLLIGSSEEAVRRLLGLFGERRLIISFCYGEYTPSLGQDVVVLTRDRVAGTGPRDWLDALRPIAPRFRNLSSERPGSDELDESAFLE